MSPVVEPRSASGLARRVLLRAVRDARALTEFSAGELDLLIRVARRAKLLARIACDAERAGVLSALPTTAQMQMASARRIVEARVRSVRWELDRVALILSRLPIEPVVAMKGSAYLLLGLPNAVGRMLADVDLLLRENELEQVEAALVRQGFKPASLSPYDERYYRAWTHELPPLTHVERDLEIDLHHNLLPRTARLRPSAAVLFDGLQTLSGSPYRVLASETLVLHSMTHLWFNSDLADALRELVDIDDLLRFYSQQDDAFWERLIRRAEELDLARPAFYALRYAVHYLACPVPPHVLERSRAWAPPALVVSLMDALVPHALFPQHPDVPDRWGDVARLLLFMRSHWIRMPPWLLTRHLSYKFYARHIKRAARPAPAT